MPKDKLKPSKEVDSVIRHFILVLILLFDSVKQAYDLMGSSEGQGKNSLSAKREIALARGFLDVKDEESLRSLLGEVEFVSFLNKETLIDLILSSPEAINRLMLKERKAALMKMKNNELRFLLKDSDKVSRLRKEQLVDLVISNEIAAKIG